MRALHPHDALGYALVEQLPVAGSAFGPKVLRHRIPRIRPPIRRMKSQHDILLGHPLFHQRLGQNQVRPIGLDPDFVALEVEVDADGVFALWR